MTFASIACWADQISHSRMMASRASSFFLGASDSGDPKKRSRQLGRPLPSAVTRLGGFVFFLPQRAAHPFSCVECVANIVVGRSAFKENHTLTTRAFPRIAALDPARPISKFGLTPGAAYLNRVVRAHDVTSSAGPLSHRDRMSLAILPTGFDHMKWDHFRSQKGPMGVERGPVPRTPVLAMHAAQIVVRDVQ